MSEALAEAPYPERLSARGFIARIAWRNLWRNPRRTWLTAGAIAFASLLVSASMSLQAGSYKTMVATATGLLYGQIQIIHPRYEDDQKLEYTLNHATETLRKLDALPGLVVAPRVEAFALVSAEERSFGGLLSGVDFDRELQAVTFFRKIAQGRLPQADDEILIGALMARNLNVRPGDEIIFLGTAKEGGVAALAFTVAGIFQSGQAELDRTLSFARLSAVQNGFALGDEVHRFVISTQPERVADDVKRIQTVVDRSEDAWVRGWTEFLPDVVQAIELDRAMGRIMYGVLLLLVSFSVVNTFIMIVFERTREFGMLLGIGMQPGLIVRQTMLEAVFVWAVGVIFGLTLSLALVGYLAVSGLPVAGIQELADTFYIEDRIYPAVTPASLLAAPLVLLMGTQLAALAASGRIYRLRAVQAVRAE